MGAAPHVEYFPDGRNWPADADFLWDKWRVGLLKDELPHGNSKQWRMTVDAMLSRRCRGGETATPPKTASRPRYRRAVVTIISCR